MTAATTSSTVPHAVEKPSTALPATAPTAMRARRLRSVFPCSSASLVPSLEPSSHRRASGSKRYTPRHSGSGRGPSDWREGGAPSSRRDRQWAGSRAGLIEVSEPGLLTYPAPSAVVRHPAGQPAAAVQRGAEDEVGGGRVRIAAVAPDDLMPGPVLAELAAEAEGRLRRAMSSLSDA